MGIYDEIINMIEEVKLTSAPVSGLSNLYTHVGLDSLGFILLLVKIEETYQITFEFAEMEKCLQVDRLISLVESKVKEYRHDSTFIN